MRSIALAVVVVTLVFPHGAAAQGTSNPLREAIKRETARLVPNRDQTTAPAQGGVPQRNWAARHPVLMGTVVGAGVGMAVIAAQGCHSSSDYTCTGLLAFGAGTGAGLGAAAGVVVGIALR
jgi:hypothetical protein